MCFKRPYFVTVLAGFFCIFMLYVIYYLSVEEKLVYPLLPTVADLLPIEKAAKTYRPLLTPSYIFQWFLLIISILGSVIIYVRYKQLKYLSEFPEFRNRPMIHKLLLLSLYVGFTMTAFLMILPYCVFYFTCQYAGIIIWILILIYEFMDIFTSLLLYDELEIKKKVRLIIFFKMAIFLISAATLLASKIFWEIAIRKFAPERVGSNYSSLQPGDWGYEAHLISAICEWAFTGATFFYFCILFTADFFYVHLAEPEMDLTCKACQ